MVFQITDKCNLQCQMCEAPRSGKHGHFDFDSFTRLVDTSSGFARSIALTGGEPLLHPRIFDIIAYSKSKGFDVYLPSNGVLISNIIARKLKTSGIKTVNVSIEGPREVHDELRGEGNFARALQGLRNLREENIECTIAATVMSVNFMYMSYIMELARNYGVTTVKFQPFNNDFVFDKSKIDVYHVKREQLKSLKTEIEHILYLSKKYKIKTNPVNYLRKLPEYFANKGTFKVRTCNVPSVTASISETGEVFPCWPMAKYGAVGNINEQPFGEIWNSAKYKNARQLAKHGKCPGCLMSCHDKNLSSTQAIRLNLVKDNIVRTLSELKRNFLWKLKRNRAQKKILVTDPETSHALREINEMKKVFMDKIAELKK